MSHDKVLYKSTDTLLLTEHALLASRPFSDAPATLLLAVTTNQTADGDVDRLASVSRQPRHRRAHRTSLQASFLAEHHRSHHSQRCSPKLDMSTK